MWRYKSISEISSTDSTINDDDNVSRKDNDNMSQIDHDNNMSQIDHDDNISRLTQPLTEDDYEISPYKTKTILKTCVFCLCYGHWAKNCNLIPNSFKLNCFRCWETNHFTKNCTFKSTVKPPWMSDSDFLIFEKQIYERRTKVFFYLLIYYLKVF
jgi:hypothetical protein